jgi:hypothetical protein
MPAATVRALAYGAKAALLLALAATGGALVGCEGERSFSAEEFVEAANERGAGLELGEPLLATDPEAEVYAVRLAEDADHEGEPATGEAEVGHGHGGGSLIVAGSDAEALAEYRRCEGAVTIHCYRAANVVLRVEADDPAELDRLRVAVAALGEGG